MPAGFYEPLEVDVPVLIFSGALDPSTPPRTGDQVAAALPDARHVVIPNEAHGIENGWEECIEPQVVRFLRDPDLSRLDFDCVARIERPPFYIPEVTADRGGERK